MFAKLKIVGKKVWWIDKFGYIILIISKIKFELGKYNLPNILPYDKYLYTYTYIYM